MRATTQVSPRSGFDDWGPPPEAQPEETDAPAPQRIPLKDRLLSVSDLKTLGSVEPLIRGIVYRDTLAQLSGAPGSYKSFAITGMACALAAGVSNWEGHRIPKRGKVVIVAAEGATGLRARCLAWCELSGVDPEELEGWLYILPCPIQLGTSSTSPTRSTS